MKKVFGFKSQIFLLLVGLFVGFFVTAQWKTKPPRATNPVTPFASLQDTYGDLTKEQESLRTKIKELKKQIDEESEQARRFEAISQSQLDELKSLEAQVGLREGRGEGVYITLNDSTQRQANPDSIAHAADMRDLVNFLWSRGAKAIAINGERIVASTSIDCIVNTVMINNTRQVPPFLIAAVGEKEALINSLLNRSNLKNIYRRVAEEGLIFKVTPSKEVIAPAFEGSFIIEKAKIKEEEGNV